MVARTKGGERRVERQSEAFHAVPFLRGGVRRRDPHRRPRRHRGSPRSSRDVHAQRHGGKVERLAERPRDRSTSSSSFDTDGAQPMRAARCSSTTADRSAMTHRRRTLRHQCFSRSKLEAPTGPRSVAAAAHPVHVPVHEERREDVPASIGLGPRRARARDLVPQQPAGRAPPAPRLPRSRRPTSGSVACVPVIEQSRRRSPPRRSPVPGP